MRIAFGNGAEPAKFTYLPVATRLHQHADVARGSGLNSNKLIHYGRIGAYEEKKNGIK